MGIEFLYNLTGHANLFAFLHVIEMTHSAFIQTTYVLLDIESYFIYLLRVCIVLIEIAPCEAQRARSEQHDNL